MAYSICFTMSKGGVGKSTLLSLFAERLLYLGKRVMIIDADVNETVRDWVSLCKEEGRSVSFPSEYDFVLIDTPGQSGAGFNYILNADGIIAPLQLFQADISRTCAWFLTLNRRIQQKVCFVPNRVFPLGSVDQAMGIQQIQKLIDEEGAGFLLPGILDRISIYPLIFDGSKVNFFDWSPADSLTKSQKAKRAQSLQKAKDEISTVFDSAIKRYGFEV